MARPKDSQPVLSAVLRRDAQALVLQNRAGWQDTKLIYSSYKGPVSAGFSQRIQAWPEVLWGSSMRKELDFQFCPKYPLDGWISTFSRLCFFLLGKEDGHVGLMGAGAQSAKGKAWPRARTEELSFLPVSLALSQEQYLRLHGTLLISLLCILMCELWACATCCARFCYRNPLNTCPPGSSMSSGTHRNELCSRAMLCAVPPTVTHTPFHLHGANDVIYIPK